jgi:hypothetical protein
MTVHTREASRPQHSSEIGRARVAENRRIEHLDAVDATPDEMVS